LQATIAEFENDAIPGVDNLDLEHALHILKGISLVFLIGLIDILVQVCRSIKLNSIRAYTMETEKFHSNHCIHP